jgi:hypothetical protein
LAHPHERANSIARCRSRRASTDEITAFVESLPGVQTVVASEAGGAPEVAWGDSFFSYEQAKMPFATIVTSDYGDFDAFSRLDRPGVFRLNVEAGRTAFEELIGYAPAAHGTVEHDYAELDRLLPHPVYATQGWVCIVNPGERTGDQVRDLLSAAHERARKRYRPSV